MILFLEDWQRFPRSIIDTQTKNKSFLRLAGVLKAMGIKNHFFMLALHNPALQGVDPFDPKLTREQMVMIGYECFENPWYFLRECARVPGEGSVVATPFEANRANIGIWWCFFNHIMTFLIQPRQTGKSFAIDTLDAYLLNIKCKRTKINLLTKDEILRRKNIQQIKDIIAELPIYLQQRGKNDTNNTEEITVASMDNRYTAHVPQMSEKRALNVGRGLVTTVIRVDESPFQTNIRLALPALLAATGAAFDKAKEAGVPYGITLTTTAGKKNDKDGIYIFNLLEESAEWTEKFYDCKNLEDLENTVKRSSRGGKIRINITLNHRQLGKTDEWLKLKIDTSTASGEEADRDYFNKWTSGSQTNPLPLHIIERMNKSIIPTMFTDISKPHGYITKWYIPEEEIAERLATGKFVMGMDTSEASGGDDISLILVDVETLDVICTGTYNETNLILFSEWVCSLLVAYVNITAIIERKSTGGMLLDYLLLQLPKFGIDPFKRLFNRIVNEYDEYRDRYQEICQPMVRRSSDIYAKYKKTFGFATASSGYASRSELYSTTLQNAAKLGCDKLFDAKLVDQISSLINKNGRIDHPDGGHDDLVIGWLLACWLLMHGKNLSFYGIDVTRVMCNAKTNNTEVSIYDLYRKEEQDRIKEKMNQILDELAGEQDENICFRLEHELRVLDRQVVIENGETYSVDSLIREAREAKIAKRRNYEYQNRIQSNSGMVNVGMRDVSGVFSDRPLSTYDIVNRRY